MSAATSKTVNKVIFISVAAAILLVIGFLLSPEMPERPEPLSVPELTVGATDYGKILRNQQLGQRLVQVAGNINTATIRQNLRTVTPVEQIDGYYVLWGLRPHRGGEDEAMLWIAPEKGIVIAWLMHNRQIQIFLPESMEVDDLPEAFTEKARHANYPNYPVEYIRAGEALSQQALD